MPPNGYLRRAGAGGELIVRADLADLPAEVWWAGGAALADAGGRGVVEQLEPRPGLHAIARTYRRGGLLGGLLGDRFLGAGRAQRELELLLAVAAAGVPTVEPLAAASRPRGAFHQLRIVTALVAGALPLPAFVAACPELRRRAMREAGRVVASAFAAGLRHADLHADNLLARAADGGVDVRLIDLDRARLCGRLRRRQCDAMLVRFARHVAKHRGRFAVTPCRTDELRFLAGLGHDRAERRLLIARLLPVLRRQLARHRIAW